MTNVFSYPANITKQKKGGYVVRFPKFPEAITQGNTIEEALREAADCLEEAIANRIVMKLDIPKPQRCKKNQYNIPLHASFAAKTALYMTMRETKITNTELARKLNCDEKEVRRLLDPHYNSKLPRIEQALQILGKQLQVAITPL